MKIVKHLTIAVVLLGYGTFALAMDEFWQDQIEYYEHEITDALEQRNHHYKSLVNKQRHLESVQQQLEEMENMYPNPDADTLESIENDKKLIIFTQKVIETYEKYIKQDNERLALSQKEKKNAEKMLRDMK